MQLKVFNSNGKELTCCSAEDDQKKQVAWRQWKTGRRCRLLEGHAKMLFSKRQLVTASSFLDGHFLVLFLDTETLSFPMYVYLSIDTVK